MKYLSIKNFDKYQHYKDRTITSWIKLYYKILDDYGFLSLRNSERWLFIGLILECGRNDNSLHLDCHTIGRRLCNRRTPHTWVSKTIGKLESLSLVQIEDRHSLPQCSVVKSSVEKKDLSTSTNPLGIERKAQVQSLTDPLKNKIVKSQSFAQKQNKANQMLKQIEKEDTAI